MSHLRPPEVALAKARQRNSRRQRRPVVRRFALRPAEVATLRIANEVTVIRQIWPPSLLSVPWCQWANPGERVAMTEDVVAIGANPDNAIYVYRHHDAFESKRREGAYYPASKAPIASSRFPMFCVSTERLLGSCKWRIVLRKCPEAMR